MRAAVDELVLAIQQALCAEYGVDRIQDIPAGVLPKLSEEGETEQVLQFIVARCPLDGLDGDGCTGLMYASMVTHAHTFRSQMPVLQSQVMVSGVPPDSSAESCWDEK